MGGGQGSAAAPQRPQASAGVGRRRSLKAGSPGGTAAARDLQGAKAAAGGRGAKRDKRRAESDDLSGGGGDQHGGRKRGRNARKHAVEALDRQLVNSEDFNSDSQPDESMSDSFSR